PGGIDRQRRRAGFADRILEPAGADPGIVRAGPEPGRTPGPGGLCACPAAGRAAGPAGGAGACGGGNQPPGGRNGPRRRLPDAAAPARVEDYLTRYPELRSDPDVLQGLIRAEYRVRRQREPALGCAEYEARFPEHGAAWATLLAEAPGPEAGAGEGRPARMAAG